ncbi:14616_t:CDS:2, partial [Gigaspora margarita]
MNMFNVHSANSGTRTTTLHAYPDVAVLNTNVSPYKCTSTSIQPTSKETGSNNQSNDITIGISV